MSSLLIERLPNPGLTSPSVCSTSVRKPENDSTSSYSVSLCYSAVKYDHLRNSDTDGYLGKYFYSFIFKDRNLLGFFVLNKSSEAIHLNMFGT